LNILSGKLPVFRFPDVLFQLLKGPGTHKVMDTKNIRDVMCTTIPETSGWQDDPVTSPVYQGIVIWS
jgi:hypothetical protein